MRDLYHDLVPKISLNAQALTAAANGDSIIDLAGFEGALIVVVAGTITDGDDYTFELKEGDDSGLSDAAAVADADLLGSEPVFATADDDKVKFFGYVGSKRYIRVDLKSCSGTPSTGGVFTALVVKGFPAHRPSN